jgi:RNase P/RNase MRP subunit p29
MSIRKLASLIAVLFVAHASHSAYAAATSPLPTLTAAQILEKNAAARGGIATWRSVQSISWKGKMGAGATTYPTVTPGGRLETKHREEAQLPFTLEFKRPFKSRLELELSGQTSVQVYDGSAGWKLRPFLGRTNWDAFTPEELQQVRAEPGIDGYLIDSTAKGIKVETAGTESIEGHDAYKLKVTLKGGEVRHVWVDGQSFLDVRVEGAPRKLDGRSRKVQIYQRDFKPEQGLLIPHVLETTVQGVNKSEKIVIDSVKVNPPIDDARFTKPK